jgi:bacillithiol system protein YtxJ
MHFLYPKNLQEIVEHSNKEPVMIFKHSLTCGCSYGAYERLEDGLRSGTLTYPTYIVTVQDGKELSSAIAKEFNVKHESPQVILVYKTKALYDEDHNAIIVGNIRQDV